MKLTRVIVGLLAALAIGVTELVAQPDPFEALIRSSRVAVLPFSNYAEVPEALPGIMTLVAEELERRGVEMAESQTVADALRKHRIRNTHELSVEEMHFLSGETAAAYLLVGSLERYVTDDLGGEVALSARLISVSAASIEWIGAASSHSKDGVRLLEVGRDIHAASLARHAVRELFQDFRYVRSEREKRVESIRLGNGRNTYMQPCESILVLPFANETGLFNAGGIFTNRLAVALDHAGYKVIEPGRVRSAMLEEGSMSPGAASARLLDICRRDLGISLILTGTVSEFQCGSPLSLEQVPSLAVEARLIDVGTGHVVWAKPVRSNGNDSNLLFGTGTTYSAASIADRLAAKLVKAIPAHRQRRPSTATPRQL